MNGMEAVSAAFTAEDSITNGVDHLRPLASGADGDEMRPDGARDDEDDFGKELRARMNNDLLALLMSPPSVLGLDGQPAGLDGASGEVSGEVSVKSGVVSLPQSSSLFSGQSGDMEGVINPSKSSGGPALPSETWVQTPSFQVMPSGAEEGITLQGLLSGISGHGASEPTEESGTRLKTGRHSVPNGQDGEVPDSFPSVGLPEGSADGLMEAVSKALSAGDTQGNSAVVDGGSGRKSLAGDNLSLGGEIRDFKTMDTDPSQGKPLFAASLQGGANSQPTGGTAFVAGTSGIAGGNVFADYLVEQVRGHLNGVFLKDGLGKATISLDPPSLGHLKIDIIVKDNMVRAEIATEHPVVKQVIEANLQGLKHALMQQGLTVDGLTVFLGDRSSGYREGFDAPSGKSNGNAAVDEVASPGGWWSSAEGSDSIVDIFV
ncbi:MAG: flagellar hook-length control protein FliK [Deltaproteobacteria bacterium]|nr:flagellar hook-length control protein FliK [Deltaproteobacteria bacterium]